MSVLVDFMLPVDHRPRVYKRHVSFLPRKDESVLFLMENDEEVEFTVKHIITIIDEEHRTTDYQVVLK